MAKEKATISATLGHEYEDLEEREDFLANNADSVEKMEFIKRFNSDELTILDFVEENNLDFKENGESEEDFYIRLNNKLSNQKD